MLFTLNYNLCFCVRRAISFEQCLREKFDSRKFAEINSYDEKK